MKIKAIIFDFDGVLFDSERLHLEACNKIFSSFGFSITEAEYFKKYLGLSDKEMFPLILNEKNIAYKTEDIKKLIAKKTAAYREIISQHDTLKSISDVFDFIKLQAKKIQHFAICSGATKAEITATLDKLERGELKQYFNCITTVEDVNSGKPSPEGYLLTANRLQISPQECLVIEDSKKGITAAKNAEMKVAAIATYFEKSVLKAADFVAESYEEINDWINASSI